MMCKKKKGSGKNTKKSTHEGKMKIMKMGQTLSEREKKKKIMCIDLCAFNEKKILSC